MGWLLAVVPLLASEVASEVVASGAVASGAPVVSVAVAGVPWAAAQDPQTRPAIVARYTLDGKPGTVSVDDLALELASRFAHTERGGRAREQLVDLELVRAAAVREGVWPDAKAVRSYGDELARQLRQNGQQLGDWLRRRGMTRDDFEREFVAPSLAHERLVMKAMALDQREKVTPELLSLWLKEARAKAGVVTEAGALPAGIVVEVGERTFSQLDLGRLLLRDGERDEREKFVRQIVVCRAAQARAEQLGVAVTAAEAAAEVEARRATAEQDVRLQGLTFEQLLQSQGTTPEQLRHSPVLRTQILARKLAAREYPEAKLDEMLQQDGDAIRGRLGARRRLGVLQLRASEAPNPLVPRTFAVAEQLALSLRESALGDGKFAHVARTNSDDAATKVRGGDAGWHHRLGSPLPDPVVAAAFALEPGAISDPIRAEDGVWLVRVDAVEPPLDAAALRERLRAELAQKVLEQLLEDAKVELVSQ